MASPHLWAPSLEPRTIINPWYGNSVIDEVVALDKEEEEYEEQLRSIKVKNKRAPIVGKYKIRPTDNNYSDDEPLNPEDDEDSEYDDGDDDDDDEEEEEEEEDLDEDIEELDDDVEDDDTEEGERSEYTLYPDSTTVEESLQSLSSFTFTLPGSPGEPSRNMDTSEFDEEYNRTYINELSSREDISFNMEQ